MRTASASRAAPRSTFSRACERNRTCFAVMYDISGYRARPGDGGGPINGSPYVFAVTRSSAYFIGSGAASIYARHANDRDRLMKSDEQIRKDVETELRWCS